jgi:drug/metabolite transporter (DMT)-like permease
MTTPTTSANANAKNWAMLIALSIIWGASFFFARIAVQEIPPLMLVLFRVAIAALALNLYLAMRGEWQAFRQNPVLPFLLLGLLNNAIPFSLLFIGQTQLGAGLAAILNALVPFWTVIAANRLTSDEKITTLKLAGIILGIIGAATIIGSGAASGLGAPLWAELAVVGAGISYAFASIYAKTFKGVPPTAIATGQMTASTLIMLPVAFLVHGTISLGATSGGVWAAVLALALVSTAYAYILFFRIVAAAGATFVSLVTLLVPVSAVILGAAFLGERLSATDFIGMGLIGLGLITVDGRLFRKRAVTA